DQRLATILIHLAQRAGTSEAEGVRLSVKLTHQDLADMAGLTKETTSRILSRLKKDHIVTSSRKQLVIQDLARLQKMAPRASSL
ncbi:MAG: winged helix-turn-helix domain-containing protein, partial [Nitrospira sp.]|nr:winged helix-turn-helix domain-containing protein [Nitrospira sp.]